MCRNVSAVLQHPLERKPLLRAVDGPEVLHCSVVTFRARGRRHNIFIATAANMISTSQQPGKQTKIKKENKGNSKADFEMSTQEATDHTGQNLHSQLTMTLQSGRDFS